MKAFISTEIKMLGNEGPKYLKNLPSFLVDRNFNVAKNHATHISAKCLRPKHQFRNNILRRNRNTIASLPFATVHQWLLVKINLIAEVSSNCQQKAITTKQMSGNIQKVPASGKQT